jgi:surface antigen
MRTGILTTRPAMAQAQMAALCAGFLLAAGPACPVLADAAPRVALPSGEAIGWLLETETTGSAAPWANSRSGYSGTLTITRTWYRADGTPCREYTVAATASGSRMTIKETTIRGTGCRAASGEWILSEDAPVLVAVVPLSPPTRKPAGPDDPSPTPPARAMTMPEPAVTQPPAPSPAPSPLPSPLPAPGPVDSGATVAADDVPPATDDSVPDTTQHKPPIISATLPSRSDE